MAAPFGNQNALGGNGGRPSAYQERRNAELLEQIFLGELDREEVKKKLASGKYSLKDVFISKAFAGNDRLLDTLFRKYFPDTHDVRETGTTRVIITRGSGKGNGYLSGADNAVAPESAGGVRQESIQSNGSGTQG